MTKKRTAGEEHSWTVSVPEAGRRYLGLGRNLSYDAAARGQIPTIKVGRLLRVPVARMEAMLSTPGAGGTVVNRTK
jgi:hypothetical protein